MTRSCPHLPDGRCAVCVRLANAELELKVERHNNEAFRELAREWSRKHSKSKVQAETWEQDNKLLRLLLDQAIDELYRRGLGGDSLLAARIESALK